MNFAFSFDACSAFCNFLSSSLFLMFATAVMASIKSLASNPLLCRSSARVLILLSGLGAFNLELGFNRDEVSPMGHPWLCLHPIHFWTCLELCVLMPPHLKNPVIPDDLGDRLPKLEVSSGYQLFCSALDSKMTWTLLELSSPFLNCSWWVRSPFPYRWISILVQWGEALEASLQQGPQKVLWDNKRKRNEQKQGLMAVGVVLMDRLCIYTYKPILKPFLFNSDLVTPLQFLSLKMLCYWTIWFRENMILLYNNVYTILLGDRKESCIYWMW